MLTIQGSTLSDMGRQKLKELIVECTGGQQLKFKRLYAHDGREFNEENLNRDIMDVIDTMDQSKLENAIHLVERAIKNNLKEEGHEGVADH